MQQRPDPELGERLAGWLEELDLAAHLDAAGLPSFERDLAGIAHWRDPGTGAALTAEQLADLDRVLRADGDDPAHAVPIELVRLRQQARVRAALLASPAYTYAALAQRRGATENATRFWVHKSAERHRLLVVAAEQHALVPAFQLDADHEPRADLLPVLEPLLVAGMDPWQVWAWLTRPAALLGGAVPHEAAADPAEADLVRHAAVRLAERT